MNIARSFSLYMESLSLGTFGTDLYIGSVPLNADDPVWWIVTSGGSTESKNQTGEKVKQYILNVYYRNTDAEDVYETLQDFEETVNSDACTQLQGFDTIELEATQFASDQDIDNQDATVGLIQVTIRTYL